MPKTRFFSSLFPKVICLSPGTTFVLPITFRPLDKIRYEDYIEVNQVEFGKSFKIPLIANLPQFKINFDNELNIGSCAVNEMISKKIKIYNLRYFFNLVIINLINKIHVLFELKVN